MDVVIVSGFIAFDIITGLIKAGYKGNYNSSIMRQGGYHKLMELIAIVVAYFIEFSVAYIHLGVNIPAAAAVAGYICVMEIISIMENVCAVNPELCALLKPYLEKLKGGNNIETK